MATNSCQENWRNIEWVRNAKRSYAVLHSSSRFFHIYTENLIGCVKKKSFRCGEGLNPEFGYADAIFFFHLSEETETINHIC